MTNDELVRFFREGPVESLKIYGFVETGDTRYLGSVESVEGKVLLIP